MGPRSADRGNELPTSSCDVTCRWLQWGRDQLIAEMMRGPVHRSSSFTWLQWGRDQLIAEISGRDQAIGDADARFNGAAIS